MKFGQHLRLQREKLGIPTEDFAKRIGVSRSYITLIEVGRRVPSKKLISKIAHELETEESIVIEWYMEHVKNKLSSK